MIVWRLAVKVVPPSNTYRRSMYIDAWRLAARVPCQAVWKRVSPSGSGAALGDNAEAEALFALDVRDLQGFGDTLNIGLLDVP